MVWPGNKMRTPIARFDDIPGSLPDVNVPEDADLALIADEAISKLGRLQESDLAQDAIWKDYLTLTGYMRTLTSARAVVSALDSLKKIRLPVAFVLSPDSWRVTHVGPQTSWIDASFTFTTNGELSAKCAGLVSLIPDKHNNGVWKIWMLRTWLENFEGQGHPDVLEPERPINGGARNGINNGTNNGTTNGVPTEPPVTNGKAHTVYDVLIVGGSQGGLACAGRMKAVGLSYVVIEKNDQVGDIWTKRYESLRWHTPKEYGNLPFDRTFQDPDDDYLLSPKSVARGHKNFAARFGIDIRLGTMVGKASWDGDTSIWTIATTSATESVTFKAKNLVLAIGGGLTVPVSPNWPERERFIGITLHGADYQDAKSWKGRNGVVIGSANTAHDVAADMVLAGCSSVTMVQRGRTYVFPAGWLHHALDGLYNTKLPTATADRLAFTYPNKIMRDMINRAVHNAADHSKQYYDDLETAGFKVVRKGDAYDNVFNRLGGHYVDIGTSERISRGEIRMKSNSLVKEWTEDGLLFEDGSELKADVVVICTGFDHDFRTTGAVPIVGVEIADAMDNYAGMDAEGEIRGAYKTTGHPALYYQGGDSRMARWYSRFIALQIQANVLGSPLKPYLDTSR